MHKLVTVSSEEEGIFVLHMDDEANRNCLTDELSEEIIQALQSLADEPSLRALVMTGRQDVFSAGASLETLEKLTSGKMNVKAFSIPSQMLSFPLPIIGALEGHAVGGGLSLALCCDMTIASETSRYGANFTEMGFTPGMGIVSLLPMQVGHSFASEMLLGAKLYKGRELAGRSLFNDVVPARDVRRVALDLALTLADKPRDVLMMLKETLNVSRRKALADSAVTERHMHLLSFGSPGSKARIRSMYIS